MIIFSACHVDRLLVGHEDYKDIFDEMLRISKPKGVLCITDVDALSITIHPLDDCTQKILDKIHKIFVNLSIGRILPKLFIESNLRDVQILQEILTINDFDISSKLFKFSDIIDDLIAKNAMTITEGQNWINTMLKASKETPLLLI